MEELKSRENRWTLKQNRKFIETLAAGWPHSDLSKPESLFTNMLF